MARREMSINYANVKIRIFALLVIFILAYGFLSYRLFLVQFLRNDRYLAQAKNQQTFKISLPARRGQILDRNNKILATSVPAKSLYAVPVSISDPAAMADLLAPIVGVDRKKLFSRLSRDKKFVWIKRKMTDEQLAALEALGDLEGLGFVEEQHRVYPNNSMLSQVIGFVDIDGNGLEGVEASMSKYLDGRPGQRLSMKDAKGREIISKVMESVPPVDGCNVQLTIDAVIQHIAERELEWGVKKFNPTGASVVVMDVNSGEVLAMANRPTFDPNNIRKSTADERRNRAVTDIFEPGSIFKIVTLSSAIDENILGPDDEVFCEYGSWSVPGHVLNDTHAYGKITMREVLQKSSNIGTAKVALMLGKEKLYKHASLLGFGRRTGIELPGEMPGTLHPTSRWSRLSIYCLPMGHEITTNTVQIVRAFCAIANGGKLMKPLVYKNVSDPDGIRIRNWEPQVEKKVLFEDTSRAVTQMLTTVVQEGGTGRKAAVPGFPVAGKTGTAQKLLPSGRGYSHKDYFSSFVGFLPAHDPKVCIGVFFDAPKPVYYGGSVAGPVFSRVGQAVMAYMGVAPIREKEETV